MTVRLRKCYNVNMIEIPSDYQPPNIPDLVEQLANIYNKTNNNSVA